MCVTKRKRSSRGSRETQSDGNITDHKNERGDYFIFNALRRVTRGVPKTPRVAFCEMVGGIINTPGTGGDAGGGGGGGGGRG